MNPRDLCLIQLNLAISRFRMFDLYSRGCYFWRLGLKHVVDRKTVCVSRS